MVTYKVGTSTEKNILTSKDDQHSNSDADRVIDVSHNGTDQGTST